MDLLRTSLLGLEVWGAPSIKIRRKIRRNNVEGKESDGDLIFRDTDTTLKIYLPIDYQMSDPKWTFLLTEGFIKHCGITDPNYQILVSPILSFKLEDIERFLERYNLDQPQTEDVGKNFPETLFRSTTGVTQDQSVTRSLEIAPETASKSNYLAVSDSANRSSSPNAETEAMLRARIPTLDQSLAKVREAGASRASKVRLSLFSSPPWLASGREANAPSGTTTPLPRDALGRSQDTRSQDVFNTDSLRKSLRDIATSTDRGNFPLGETISSEKGMDGCMTRGARTRRTQGFGAEAMSLQNLHIKQIGLLGEVYVRPS